MRLYILIFSLFFLLHKSYANCNHPDDFLALKQLYYSTNGDNWVNSTNWDIVDDFTGPQPNTDLSQMYGISCNANGRVSQVYLANNNLSGDLTENIGYITEVVNFDLSDNNINGSLPVEIGNFTYVQNFNLRNNNFIGSIPVSIGNNSSIEYLDLSYNQLSGTIPFAISSITSLQELKLNFNNFTSGLHSSFFTLPNLEKLILSDNEIEDIFPVYVVDPTTTNLETILIQNNEITGELSNDFAHLTSLKYLNINSNNITGSIPDAFCNITGIESIQFFNNQITGKLPVCFAELDNLYSLMLANNNLEGCIPYQYNSFCNNGVSVNLANNPNLTNTSFFNFCWYDTGSCYIGDVCDDPILSNNLPANFSNHSTCLFLDDYFVDDINCGPTVNVLDGKEGVYLLDYNEDFCINIEMITDNANFSMMLSNDCPNNTNVMDCKKLIDEQNSYGHIFENIWLPKDSVHYLTIAGVNNSYGNCINYDLNVTEAVVPLVNQWIGGYNNLFTDASNWSLGAVPGHCENIEINTGYAVELTAGNTIYASSLSVEAGAELNVELGAELSIMPK